MIRPHMTGALANCEIFRSLSPTFAKAIDFLREPGIASLAPGRYDIDGDVCWANVQDADLVPHGERKLEAHRRFVDVQAPLTGPETIGFATMDAAALALPFDVERDCVLFEGPSRPVTLTPGEFAVFLPPLGAHAPCCRAPDGPDRIRKVVVKILLSAAGVEAVEQ